MIHILAILSLGMLCVGWIGIQYIARKMGTKNHFEDNHERCGNCSCGGGGTCTR